MPKSSLSRQQLIIAGILILLVLILALKFTNSPTAGKATQAPSNCVWTEHPDGSVGCENIYAPQSPQGTPQQP